MRAANQLTDSGPAWYDMVSRYNSGTYNNQYMVLDTKRFKANNALQSNTLFVVEQIPGLMAGADVTEQLERGYWSSYNGKKRPPTTKQLVIVRYHYIQRYSSSRILSYAYCTYIHTYIHYILLLFFELWMVNPSFVLC